MRLPDTIRCNASFVVSILSSAAFIGSRMVSAAADDPQAGKYTKVMAYLKSLAAAESKLKLWWCRPLDAKWSRYEFQQITGAAKKNLIGGLANSEFSSDAGNFYTLEMPFELADSRGQGFLVVQDRGREKPFGFRFRAIAANKHALEFADVFVFDSETESLKYNLSHDFAGVTIKTDFRSVLAAANADERAPAEEPKMPNKSQMATPRKPSD